MRTRLSRWIGGFGLLMMTAAMPANAVTLDELIGQMDSDDLLIRDSATEELRKRLSDTTDAQSIEAGRSLEMDAAEVLRTRTLTLEQRVRLFDALRDRFFRTPRGAMGVQFVQPPTRLMGVELGQVIQGFPAAEQGLLKAGDVITSVGGVPLIGEEMAQFAPNGQNRAQERLRHIVISHDPDELIELTVVRPLAQNAGEVAKPNVALVRGGGDLITEGPGKNAQVLTIEVPLGSFDRLRQGNFLDQQTLEGAWQQRSERLGIPPMTARILGTPLTLQEWAAHRRASLPEAPALLAAAERPGAEEFVRSPLAGGKFPANELEVRQAPAPIEERLMRAARMANRPRGMDPGAQRGIGQNGDGPRVVVQGPAKNGNVEDILSMLQTLGALTKQRDLLLAQAADPALSAKQQRAAAEEAATLHQAIGKLDSVLKQRLIENAKAEEKK
ncbi:MAG: PDZ domain-containing protein [Phycisphaerae bacterium]|nr:PDZ domain-containing protein [Phycisphaerae bacterium]